MALRSTHTFAGLQVSPSAYDEIAGKLREAGYDHAFDEGVIDMQGIGLQRAPADEFTRGALWQDADGFARVQCVVEVAGTEWAVMRRWRPDDDPKHPRLRRPFLFSAKSLRRGVDGWQHVPEAQAHG